MRGRPPLRPAAALGVVVLASITAGCSADRDGGSQGIPGVTTAPDPNAFVPGTLDEATARPYLDGLVTNFVEGGRLAVRLDTEPAECVAERWVAVLEPARLEAGGVTGPAMADITLDLLRQAVDIDAPRAASMIDGFADCDASYEEAFLESLLVVDQVSLRQQVCLANALPDDVVASITEALLAGEEAAAAAAAQYGEALDLCAN